MPGSFQTGNWRFNSIRCTRRVNVLHGSLCCSAYSLPPRLRLCASANGGSTQRGAVSQKGPGHEQRVCYRTSWTWEEQQREVTPRSVPQLNVLLPAQRIQSPWNNFRIWHNAALKGLSTWLNLVGHTHSHPHYNSWDTSCLLPAFSSHPPVCSLMEGTWKMCVRRGV